jgi:hypothetical protein
MWDEFPAGIWECPECGAFCGSVSEMRACADRDLSETD